MMNCITSSAQNGKFVVVEERTGTWCHYCPEGIVYGDSLVHKYDSVFFIAIHSGDPMEFPDYVLASGLNISPSANINRVIEKKYPTEWEAYVVTQLGITSPVSLKVETDFNDTIHRLDVKITAYFNSSLSGDLRLGGVIIEDGITGIGTGYNQTNYYSNSGITMGGFENLPNPVPASIMVYNNVPRELLGGYWGLSSSVPSSVSAGDSVSCNFTWKMPAGYDPKYIYVIGWLVDSTANEIINAGRSLYLPGNSNAVPQFISFPDTVANTGTKYEYNIIARDPDDFNLQLSINGSLPSWLTFTDLGNGNAELQGTPVQTGIYPVSIRVSDGQWQIDQNFNIQAVITSQAEKLIQFNPAHIFPNPCRDILYIQCQDCENAIYEIFNLQGKFMRRGELLENSHNTSKIDLNSLRNGFYKLLISSQGNYYSHKLIVIR